MAALVWFAPACPHAGDGYKPMRSFIGYAVVIVGFMGQYLLNSQFVASHLAWNGALGLSMSSLHGRASLIRASV